jgi:hypothetical protein
MAASRRKWADANPEQDREAKRGYAARKYKESPDTLLERSRISREKNRDEMNRRRREKRAANIQEAREADRRWVASNPDKVTATRKRSYLKQRAKPSVRINASMAAGVRHSLVNGSIKGGRRWERLVGYTFEQLMAHLESKFRPGMSWENYGKRGWEIDHIVPLTAHNFDAPEDFDFHRAWALSNLQPLWKLDNVLKSNKLAVPFQPSLSFGAPDNDNNQTSKAA